MNKTTNEKTTNPKRRPGRSTLPTPSEVRVDLPILYTGAGASNIVREAAMESLRRDFDARGHYPSQQQYDGLEQIANVIEAMACSAPTDPRACQVCPEIANSFFVSFLPCGVGKTSILEASVKAILETELFHRIGIIIFLQRCDMIEAMVERMALSERDYAVMVSDEGPWKRLNQKGITGDKRDARVLFTTQQRLEKLSKDGTPFAGMTDFFFNRKPRQVRVWDEAIVPAETFSIRCKKLVSLVDKLNKVDPTLSDTVFDFGYAVKQTESGGLVSVPSFGELGVTLEDALRFFKDKADREIIQALWALRGKMARVTHDPQGNVMIQYADILPDDLAPMLILDASGGQRTTYKLWYQHRKGIKFLYSPQKSYEGFTIHHWDRGSGKSAHDREKGHADELAEGIAKAINHEVPRDKEVLVIHHKPDDDKINMEDEIRSRLEGNTERVHYMTWGMHTATNKYAEVEYVFLAGVLQYSSAAYEATGMAARGRGIEEELTDQEIEEIKLGEAYHNILQAACRGKVRKSEDAGCPPGCHLYMIYSSQSLPKDLPTNIFPGAELRDWRPIAKKMTDQQQRLFDELVRLGKREATISKHALMARIGFKEIGNLDRSLGNATVMAAIKEAGYYIATDRKTVTMTKVNPWGF